jgi:hypothetical protein
MEELVPQEQGSDCITNGIHKMPAVIRTAGIFEP